MLQPGAHSVIEYACTISRPSRQFAGCIYTGGVQLQVKDPSTLPKVDLDLDL